jgi:hypothetical protein
MLQSVPTVIACSLICGEGEPELWEVADPDGEELPQAATVTASAPTRKLSVKGPADRVMGCRASAMESPVPG